MKRSLGILVGILAMFVLLFTYATGQVRRKPPQNPKPAIESTPKPQPPIMVEKATTETGKFVILKSDGTWEYDTAPRQSPVAAPPLTESKATLRFKAAIVTKSGNIIPAARGSFQLLDQDIRIILGSKAAEKRKSGKQLDILTAYMMSMDYALIKPHIVATTTTDFDGNGVFEAVEAKTYYVFFFSFIGQNSILWSVKVDLNSGDNYIVLDQNNALETFSR